ncbi:bursicon-like [Patiria miniata]|uniref:Bursicon n=1 Tax=Patiria miniata TaxID=46514 RepID=A0A913YZR5_PATMI|nr:bursicon-like [Patiria miniata]
MKSHQRPVSMVIVVRGALFLLLLLACSVSQTTTSMCRKLTVRHLIKDAKPGCRPKWLTLYGCRGTCFSYARVSPRDYVSIERSCQCCQEVGYRTVRVRFDCPQRLPPYHYAEVRLVRDCRCRPCNTMSVGDVPEVVRLTDYFPN